MANSLPRTLLIAAAVGVITYGFWRYRLTQHAELKSIQLKGAPESAIEDTCPTQQQEETASDSEQPEDKPAPDSPALLPVIESATLPPTIEHSIFIVYSSTSGSTAAVSERLEAELQSQSFRAGVLIRRVNLAALAPAQLLAQLNQQPRSLALFLIPTFKGGQPPLTALPFFNYLRSNEDNLELVFDFAVLGFGESSRHDSTFSLPGTELDKCLASGGATRILPVVHMDAAFKVEFMLTAWIKVFKEQLRPDDRFYDAPAEAEEVVDDPETPLVVYGTYAQTSRLMAEETAAVLSSHTGREWQARNMAGLSAESLALRKAMVVFIVCSHTYGDLPPSCDAFVESVKQDIQNMTERLTNLEFAILGTGDTFYFKEIFCKAAYDLKSWLLSCGACEVMALDTADLNKNQFVQFRVWLYKRAVLAIRQHVVSGTEKAAPVSSDQIPAAVEHTEIEKKKRQANEESEAMEDSELGSVGPATRDNVERVKVLFATQSGTAEGLARKVVSAVQSVVGGEKEVILIDVEKYKRHAPPEAKTLHVFVVATYGDGDPPDSAVPFWNYMKKKAGVSLVEGGRSPWASVPVVIIGLGNAGYPNFCQFAVKLSKRFKSYESNRVLPLVRLDELDAGYESVFDTWLALKLKPAVSKLMGVAPPPSELATLPEPAQSDKTEFSLVNTADLGAPTTVSNSSRGKLLFALHTAQIEAVDFIGPNGGQDRPTYKVLVTFDQMCYAGANFAFYPPLSDPEVDELMQLVTWEGQCGDSLRASRFEFNGPESPVPQSASLRSVVQYMTDFSFTPSHGWMQENLMPLLRASHPLHKLLTPAWHQANIAGPTLTLQEVLRAANRDHPVRLPVDFILALPRLLIRQYTIASSVISEDSVNKFSLVVCEASLDRTEVSAWAGDAVKSQRLLGRVSSFLRRLAEENSSATVGGVCMPSQFKEVHFKMGGVWIATGAGIAPFLAFLGERRRLSAPADCPRTMLFYGCRSSLPEDFVGSEEVRRAVADGFLTNAFFAFSRNEPGQQRMTVDRETGELISAETNESIGEGRYYVIDALREQKKNVVSCLSGLEEETGLFMCGSTRMALPSMNTVDEHMKDVYNGSYIGTVKQRGKVVVEIW